MTDEFKQAPSTVKNINAWARGTLLFPSVASKLNIETAEAWLSLSTKEKNKAAKEIRELLGEI